MNGSYGNPDTMLLIQISTSIRTVNIWVGNVEEGFDATVAAVYALSEGETIQSAGYANPVTGKRPVRYARRPTRSKCPW